MDAIVGKTPWLASMPTRARRAGSAVMVVLVLALSGCGSQDADVAGAQRDAAKDLAEARDDAARDIAEADAKVDEARRELADGDRRHESLEKVEAEAADDRAAAGYDLAISKAEARHKVALESCEGLERAAQNLCINRADTALVADRDAARQQRDALLTETGLELD